VAYSNNRNYVAAPLRFGWYRRTRVDSATPVFIPKTVRETPEIAKRRV
jgi:hypothetical protein